MNNINWQALKAAVEESKDKCDEANCTVDLGKDVVPEYSIELNGVSIDVEINKSNIPDNTYAMRKRLLAYCKYFQCMQYKTDEVKALYNSVFEYLAGDFEHLCGSMKEDIQELDICYASGAYKATLILSGSILEAFLLDWLSEIDGRNYFEEPYKIKVRKEDGTYRWEKKEQLNVYIEQIKELERPDWMEPSEKAHFIRESRNSVHAKVCLKKEIGINAETCSKVITYLKDIIDTRLEKRKSELMI